MFSIYNFNPLTTPFFLYFLCHPLFKPSLVISLFAMVTCLFLIFIIINAPIGSMLRTRVLTHIPSYHVLYSSLISLFTPEKHRLLVVSTGLVCISGQV